MALIRLFFALMAGSASVVWAEPVGESGGVKTGNLKTDESITQVQGGQKEKAPSIPPTHLMPLDVERPADSSDNTPQSGSF